MHGRVQFAVYEMLRWRGQAITAENLGKKEGRATEKEKQGLEE